MPIYDIATSARVGHRPVKLDDAPLFVAEGLFAARIVAECKRRGLLADAICVRHNRLVTFALRLVRDLRERRKPPMLLLRRGWRLMRDEPHVVEQMVRRGCRPMTPHHAESRIRRLVAGSR